MLYSNGNPNAKNRTPLKDAIRDCKSAIYLMVFVTAVINLLSIAPILYMMNVFDRVLPTNSTVTLVSLLVLVLGLYVFWTALEWLRTRLMIRISLRIDWDLATSVFNACFRKSLSNTDANVHQAMNDMQTLRQFITGPSLVSLVDGPFAIVFMVIAYLIHPWLAGFIVVSTLILLVITLVTKQVTTAPIEAANNANLEANRLAAASLKNAEVAVSMGMLPSLRKRWYSLHRSYLQHQVNSSESNGFIGMIGGVFSKSLPSLQITIAVILAGMGLISAGGVIAASFLIGKATAPLKTMITKWEEVIKAKIAFERLDQLLANQELIEQKMQLPAPLGHLTAKELTVMAPKSDRPILRGVNFDVPAGQILAIVGPNASGKTSLLKCMLGLWKPFSGTMRLDGAEVADWRHEELGQHIGYVSQSTGMFEGTVAENIARLDEVDSQAVVAAAKAVGVHEMILGFPKGYDTILGNGSFELSGGQSQRLALARAIYKTPKLLVLDEPNSNLDDQAEIQLQKTILALKAAGSTVVLTSHRARLVSVSDWMLLLKDGFQVRFGPTGDLLPELSGKREVAATSVVSELRAPVTATNR
jgi:ATP-binding cassette, subfamily C, bacterial exporter for protease/lipase